MCSTEAVGLLKFKKARPGKSSSREAAVVMRSETAREKEDATEVRERKGAEKVRESKGSDQVGSVDLPTQEHQAKPVLKHLTFEAAPSSDAASSSPDTSAIRLATVGGDGQLPVSAPQGAALDRRPSAAPETPVPEPPSDVTHVTLTASVAAPARIFAPSLVHNGGQTGHNRRSQESTRLQAAGDEEQRRRMVVEEAETRRERMLEKAKAMAALEVEMELEIERADTASTCAAPLAVVSAKPTSPGGRRCRCGGRR